MKGIFDRFSGDSASVEIDAETVHEFLANERRRQIVSILSEFPVSKRVEVSDLVERMVDEFGQVRKHCYISVIQQHAPAYSSLLRYDDREKTVVVTEEVKALAEAQKSVEDVVTG